MKTEGVLNSITTPPMMSAGANGSSYSRMLDVTAMYAGRRKKSLSSPK
ncbi:hypothetical protein O9993_08225 [Vibrio lentus]|nr:hypothetical protein [Vibrio lentus]